MNHLVQYTCPMHPQIIKEAQGNCPVCNMELIPVRHNPDPHESNVTSDHASGTHHHSQKSVAVPNEHKKHLVEEKHAGHAHDKHAGHHTHDFLKRFWVCLAVTIPVLLLSHMIQQWLGFEIRFSGVEC